MWCYSKDILWNSSAIYFISVSMKMVIFHHYKHLILIVLCCPFKNPSSIMSVPFVSEGKKKCGNGTWPLFNTHTKSLPPLFIKIVLKKVLHHVCPEMLLITSWKRWIRFRHWDLHQVLSRCICSHVTLLLSSR